MYRAERIEFVREEDRRKIYQDHGVWNGSTGTGAETDSKVVSQRTGGIVMSETKKGTSLVFNYGL